MKTMNIAELNWKTWLAYGDQYLKAGTPKTSSSRFNVTIRYNLLSIALENYIMAILDYYHILPENHTYTDLLTSLDKVFPIDKELKERILQYENIQSICSMEKYHINDPTDEELNDLNDAVKEIGKIIHLKLDNN